MAVTCHQHQNYAEEVRKGIVQEALETDCLVHPLYVDPLCWENFPFLFESYVEAFAARVVMEDEDSFYLRTKFKGRTKLGTLRLTKDKLLELCPQHTLVKTGALLEGARESLNSNWTLRVHLP